MPGKREAAALAKMQAKTLAAANEPAVASNEAMISAYAVVIAPSSGDGITGAKLLKFTVPIASGVQVGVDDMQEITLARCLDAIEDGIVNR
jgi:hypothetical protein